jgi:17beta-estradiol 17-dehydrogenase / very-long-chain 3-oxoacyl-CoA reductase
MSIVDIIFEPIKYFFYAYLIFVFIKIVLFIYKNFIRKRHNLQLRYGGKDTWAMITGATDGIGRGFCEELAREGFNIILVSRTLDKLQKVAQEISSEFKVKTHVVQFNFAENFKPEDYTKTFNPILENFDVAILVNNVGFNHRGYHTEIPLESFITMINVNILPQTILTKVFSEKLMKRNKRSAIIDLSSVTAEMPLSYRAMYAATKSFNYYLSRALGEEYKNLNIDFLCVKPLFVASLMTMRKADNCKVITPNQCAGGSLNDLGYEFTTFGHWIHKIQAFFMLHLPAWLVYKLYERKKVDLCDDLSEEKKLK